jgi:hypothetical protein
MKEGNAISDHVAAVGDPAGNRPGGPSIHLSPSVAPGRPGAWCRLLSRRTTLYDWVSFFVPAFFAMLDKQNRCSVSMSIRCVTRFGSSPEHGNTELLRFSDRNRRAQVSRADRGGSVTFSWQAFGDGVRDDNLRLYQVGATPSLSASGCRVFGYTEATRRTSRRGSGG